MRDQNVLQLRPNIRDSEISKLASLFTKSTLEKVAEQCFEMQFAEMTNLGTDHIQNTEGFNKKLLADIRTKTGTRQVSF